MSDLISRQAAKEAVCYMCRWSDTEECYDCGHPIDELPSIDPVKHGKWTYDDEMNTGIYAICSECGESVYQAGEWLFCPRCGAKMEEGKDEAD